MEWMPEQLRDSNVKFFHFEFLNQKFMNVFFRFIRKLKVTKNTVFWKFYIHQK